MPFTCNATGLSLPNQIKETEFPCAKYGGSILSNGRLSGFGSETAVSTGLRIPNHMNEVLKTVYYATGGYPDSDPKLQCQSMNQLRERKNLERKFSLLL